MAKRKPIHLHEWKFKSVHGAAIPEEDVQKYGEAILEIMEEKEDGCTKHDVLDAARNPKSPLHDYFEWDDSVAAENWRIAQAQKLIRNIEVVYSEQFSDPIRAFIDISPSKLQTEHLFMPITKALSDDEIRTQLMESLIGQIDALRKKLRTFEEFVEIVTSMDRFIEARKVA